MIDLYIYKKSKITYIQRNYLHTEKPRTQFPPLNCEEKHPRKSNIPGKDSSR